MPRLIDRARSNLISGPSMTVLDGYINKNTQLAQLRDAGQRLDTFRSEFYYNGSYYPNNGEPDEVESQINPVARHDFDFAEAAELSDSIVAASKRVKHYIRKRTEQERKENLPSTAPRASEGGENTPPVDAGEASKPSKPPKEGR